MKKNKKSKFVDDGRTIYNMDVDGLPKRKEKNKLNLTKEERKLVIQAAIKHYFPILIGVILCFLFAMLLIKWWLG